MICTKIIFYFWILVSQIKLLMDIISRPLKTIFRYKVCINKLYADSFYKVQKNSHVRCQTKVHNLISN